MKNRRQTALEHARQSKRWSVCKLAEDSCAQAEQCRNSKCLVGGQNYRTERKGRHRRILQKFLRGSSFMKHQQINAVICFSLQFVVSKPSV